MYSVRFEVVFHVCIPSVLLLSVCLLSLCVSRLGMIYCSVFFLSSAYGLVSDVSFTFYRFMFV